MVRHISVFTFLEKSSNGKTKAENVETVRACLETVPGLYPVIRRQTMGVTLGGPPALPEDALVMFGDLIQIIDFDSEEDAAGYLRSDAHLRLTEAASPMLKKVTAIDFNTESV